MHARTPRFSVDEFPRRFRPLAFLLLCAVAAGQGEASDYSDTVLTDAPIVYWRLGETSGNSAVNLGTLGSAANASYSGGHSKGQPGLIASDASDTAVLFSGGDVSPGNVNGVNRSGPFTDKTVELWFKANSIGGRQVMYEQGGGTRGLVIYLDDSTLYVCGWNNANDDGGAQAAPWGDPPVYVSAPDPIVAGTIYHVVLVMEGHNNANNGRLHGYLNGVTFGQTSGVGKIWDHNPAVVGRVQSGVRFHDDSTGGNGLFDGVIDEVALYSTALSAARIAAHYAAGTSLVGHWMFDETSGTTAVDSSGSGNDGTLRNGPVWSNGMFDGGLTLDGNNDYVRLPASDTLIAGDSSVTMAAWFKTPVSAPAPSDAGMQLLTLYYGRGSSTKLALGFYGDDGDTLMVSYCTSGGTERQLLHTGVNYHDDEWHHLACTYDEATNLLTLYFDGAAVTSVDAGTIIDAGSARARIGALDNSDGHFAGTIDEVRLYRSALSAGEVSLLYGLVAHWKLDETSGFTAYDATGNGLHGTLESFPVWSSGKVGGALDFDGDNDAVDLGSIGSGHLLQMAGSDVSIAAWFKQSSGGDTWQRIVDKSDGASGAGGYALIADPNSRQIYLCVDASSIYVTTAGAYSFDTWTHVVGVITATDFRIYINGVEAAGNWSTGSAAQPTVATTNMRLGTWNHTTGREFEGLLDDVRIYNRALTGAEISAMLTGSGSGGVRVIQWVEIQ